MRLVWAEGWEELGHPPVLLPMIAPVDQWESWTKNFTVPREAFREEIVTVARQLLAWLSC